MSLQAAYKQFLAAPNSAFLNHDASLNYITTTTSYKGATDIIKHFGTLRNQVKRKKDDILSVIEGQNAVAIEVDTVLEFVTSGGPYLPGLDDNFLADRTVYLAVMHVVHFDVNGKILQIRQSWDQAALLKQLDIIGKTGRNWPIRDSKEQIRLITTCLKSTGTEAYAEGANTNAARSRVPSGNITRDPHASLALFASREEADQGHASVISPRGGARPRQRDAIEIFGDEPADGPASPSAGRERSESLSKAIAPKQGAGKNYQPSRLFDTDEVEEDRETSEKAPSPERLYQPNANKYNHFDFADGSEPQDAPRPGLPTPQKTKHSSQWSFDDFVTPGKVNPTRALKKNHQDVRHWGNEDDVVEDTPAPRGKSVPVQARTNAESHFEFQDDGTPKGEPRANQPRGVTHNKGLGLYKNNVYSEEGEQSPSGGDGQALGNITNLKGRGKTFQSQFAMEDDTPPQKHQSKPSVGEDRKKAVKMMDANWSTYDISPAQKENVPTQSNKTTNKTGGGIHIGGDGMGGSKGTNRDWLFGDDDGEQATQATKSVPGRKQGGAAAGGFNWDF